MLVAINGGSLHSDSGRSDLMSLKVALHEAGHARVTMHYGFDASAEIEPDPLATGRTGMALTLRPDPTPASEEADAYVAALSPEEKTRLLDEYLWWLATIALAGPAAERLLAPDANEDEIDATSDADQDRAAVVLWDRSDAPERLQANLSKARAEARALVRQYSSEIVVIAVALMERKRLGPKDLHEILNREAEAVA